MGYGTLGVGCWRGVPTTCDGAAPVHAGESTDVAGRKTASGLDLVTSVGNLTDSTSPTSQVIAGVGFGDFIALLSGGAIVGLLCLCAIGLFICKRCSCCRRVERRVVPVVRAPVDKISGTIAAGRERITRVVPAALEDITAVASNASHAASSAVHVVADNKSVRLAGSAVTAAADLVNRTRPGYLKRRQTIALQRELVEAGRKRKLAEEAAKEEAEREKRREAKILASKLSFVDIVDDELLHQDLGVLPPTPQRLHHDWAKRDRAAIKIQRMVRSRFVRRYMREWRRHRAAKRLQAAARRFITRRKDAAILVQRSFRPKLRRWVNERTRARRLAVQLSEVIETTREVHARQTFARRYVQNARDVDDASSNANGNADDLGEDDAMEAYLDSLRRAAGLLD